MKIQTKWLLLALTLAIAAVFLAPAVQAAIDGGYVGSAACGVCHTDNYNTFIKSGHPYKVRFTKGLTPVASGGDNVTTITDPLSALLTPTLPLNSNLIDPNNETDVKSGTNLDWSTISYVIGGWGWKARYGVKDNGATPDSATGYIWSSSGAAAQYNLETGTYSAYGSATKTYTCAICHNTNGTSSADAGCITPLSGTRTEPWASSGLAYTAPGGFRSEWTFSGVQCEACHGPGQGHGEAGTISVLSLNNGTVEICAKCHIRSNNSGTPAFGSECGIEDSFPATYAILTKGATGTDPFIGHHEQYNEMHGLNNDGVHASLKCTDCHDPHKRAAGVIATVAAALGISSPSEPAMGAIKKQCGDCHSAQADADAAASAGSTQGIMRDAGVTCVDCHMSEASKTATQSSISGWGRKGDLKTHIFKIKPSTDSIWRSNGAPDNKTIAQNYLTPKYACGKCHDGFIGTATTMTEGDAVTAATGYHNVTGIDNGYVGAEACAGCHTQNYNDFVQSGHPYKVRFTKGQKPVAGTPGAGEIYDPLSAALSSTMPNTADLLNPNSETNVKVTDINGKLDWSAVSYVIGGFGWKARWGVKDTVDDSATGFIWSSSVSSPTGAQFNMLAADATLDPKGHRANWSTYGSATKKYSCAICHNTNGTSSVDALCSTPLNSGRTEPWASSGLVYTAPGGFQSEWTFSGVQCEACHGPAVNHVKSPSANTLGVLRVTYGANDYEVCAKCHIRSNNNATAFGSECGGDAGEAILTGGSSQQASGFESHHQQFNQVFGYNGDGAHASLECTACHNPHKRSATVTSGIATALGITDNNQSAEARGAVVSCESCHPGKTLVYSMGDIKCIDCHMGSTTQTATNEKATGTTDGIAAWGKQGDVSGHIFKINPAATTVTRTNAAGKIIATNSITVDFACGKCHDPYMNDFGNVALTQAQAQLYAKNIHNSIPTASFGWSADAVTSFKVNFTASGCQTGDTCTYDWDFGDGNTALGIPTAAISYTYADSTIMTASLVINNITKGTSSSPSAKTVLPLSMNTAPVASYTLSISGWTVTVTDTSTDEAAFPAGAVKVYWGDGATSTGNAGAAVSHTYTRQGSYIIRMSITDADGKKVYAGNSQAFVPQKFTISGKAVRGVCSDPTKLTQATCLAPATWGPSTTPVSSASIRLMKGGRRC